MSINISNPSKRWDLSIEMLKAIAVLLVMNSHMDAMYGEYSYLGTGGAIGDALFFFCSGYGLFLSKRNENFFNWYKRRIQRIIPSVLVISLIAASYSLLPQQPVIVANLGTIWFIYCIFIYYILLYPIKRYAANYMWVVMGVTAVLTLLWYFTIGVEERSAGNIYGGTYFKWMLYFMFMLLGAICGKWRMDSVTSSVDESASNKKIKITPNFVVSLIGVLLSLGAFYGIYIYTQRSAEYEVVQLISIIPLLSLCWFLWRFANTDFSVRLMHSKYVGTVLRFVGGLCLEILLCQGKVFTTELNFIFPWNIPLLMIGAVLFAYVIRIFSRFLLQTFQTEDYDWRAMIAPF